MSDFNTQKITQESGEVMQNSATFEITDNLEINLEVPELEDVNHPLVPEINDSYKMREIHGTQDLKLLSFAINDPDYFAMIEGEAAVGKNMALKTIAATCNWPMLRCNFSIGTTYQSLVGRYAPVDDEDDIDEDEIVGRAEVIEKTATRLEGRDDVNDRDEARSMVLKIIPELLNHSNFRWVDGLLTRAVKNGWMFVADEINAADEEAVMPLNGLTEDSDSRYLTIEEKSEVIEPHPRFRFIATRNPVTYAGVSEMNSALESRAYVIEFDYHEDEAIQEILKDNTDIVENETERAMEQLVSLVQDIRNLEQGGNECITKVSTRDLIKIGRLTDIMDIEDAAKTVILGIADPTDKQSLREMINTQKFR